MTEIPAPDGKHVFISYSRGDKDFAQWLSLELARAGVPVWNDSASLEVGSPSWDRTIRDAIGEAFAVVFIASPASRKSPYVRSETALTEMYQRPIYPIWAAGEQWIELVPLNLLMVPYIDFRDDKAEAGLSALLEALGKHMPPRTEAAHGNVIDGTGLVVGGSVVKATGELVVRLVIDGEAALKEAEAHRAQGKLDAAAAEFLRALQDTDRDNVRASAVRGLGELRWHNNHVLEALKDPSPEVRKEAAVALARIGAQVSRLPLEAAVLQDESLAVRLYARLAVMAYESRALIPAWLNNLASASADSHLAEAISSAQLRFNDLLDAAPQHVFISYTRRDAETFAVQLTDSLRQTGFSVWMDTNLEPGTPVWMHEIEKAIRQAGVCVIILSPAVHDSEWVPKEVSFARQFHKPLIPIKYQETHKPLYLSTEQGLRDDLAFSEYPEQMLAALVQALDRLKLTRTR